MRKIYFHFKKSFFFSLARFACSLQFRNYAPCAIFSPLKILGSLPMLARRHFTHDCVSCALSANPQEQNFRQFLKYFVHRSFYQHFIILFFHDVRKTYPLVNPLIQFNSLQFYSIKKKTYLQIKSFIYDLNEQKYLYNMYNPCS